jgi:hypothetical protein
MSTLETNLIQPSTGTTLTVGASGDTIDIPSGATFDVTGATVSGLTTGKILQVVQGTHGTEDNFGNTSYQATETDVDITPSATSSKVLVTVTIPFVIITKNDEFVITIYRDSTNLALTAVRGFGTLRAKDSDYYAGIFSASFLDTPSSTSALHYEAYVKRDTGSGNIYLNYNTAATSTITAMEIGA